MSNIIVSSWAPRVRPLAVVCLLASACAPVADLDDVAEPAAQRAQQEAPDAGADEDDLIPLEQGGGIFGAYFKGEHACAGMASVMDAWGPTSLVDLPGPLLSVTHDKPADRIPCIVRISVSPRRGMQMAVVSVTHRGSLRLAAHSELALTTYFESHNKQFESITLLEEGPVERTFEAARAIPSAQRVWSPCGEALDVVVVQAAKIDQRAPARPENELRLPGDAGGSAFSVNVGVRRCTPPG
ncbi:MAG: DUF4360 domain-containing protein [Polyangiales bacterium]